MLRRRRSRPFNSLEALEVRQLLTTFVVGSLADTIDENDGETTLREAVLASVGGDETSRASNELNGLLIGSAGQDIVVGGRTGCPVDPGETYCSHTRHSISSAITKTTKTWKFSEQSLGSFAL